MSTIDAYETKSGKRWRVIYRKPDGAQTSRRGFLRKRDAEEWLAEHVTIAKASGSFIDPSAGRRKVGDLWPAWIGKKRISSKASYIESLERAWRVHVEPQWAGRPVGSLARAEIQEWVSRQAGEKSATVVLRNLGILRGICDDAVADRLIQSNPCDGVETPRKKRKDHTYLTAAQLFRLADESGDRRTMVLVLGLSGPQWIHRWERDGQQDPPLDAWQTVENAARRHWELVDAILQRVHGQGLPEGTRIDLTYYRSQAEYDRYGRDRGPYRQVNAVSLHAGLLLTQAGYKVAYVAPQGLPPVERAGIRLTRDSVASGRI